MTSQPKQPPHLFPLLLLAFVAFLLVNGYRNYRILQAEDRLHRTPCMELSYEEITKDNVNFARCQFELQLRYRARAQLAPL